MINYYWIRIYDYKKDDELKSYAEEDMWGKYKGILLDEYYLSGEEMTREQAKAIVKERSCIEKFAKPRKNDGIYAIVMDSNKYYYDGFTKEVDTICFNSECNKHIKGKEKYFPSMTHQDKDYYFCCWDCYREVSYKINPHTEGEWQSKENYTYSGVYGYIYHIYNRKTDMHYIGQTVYMPFFRWQEHVKSGLKGNITDLVFETITEVRVSSQEYLNNIEAWWIRKYIDEYGKDKVMNITVPKITMEELIEQYGKSVGGQMYLSLS